jgi:hypothetical protein
MPIPLSPIELVLLAAALLSVGLMSKLAGCFLSVVARLVMLAGLCALIAAATTYFFPGLLPV